MERLTKRIGNSVAYSDFNSNHSDGCYEMMDNCLQKLADYEDKQEQGLLLLLPVAEGTEVWCIGSCGEICDNWSVDCSNCEEHQVVFCTNFDRNMTEQWGITVFPTKVEAEEALAKMGGK